MVSGRNQTKPGFLRKHKPSLMDEAKWYNHYADGPFGFQMDVHDSCMVGTLAEVHEIIDNELIYPRSVRWKLLPGVPDVVMRPNDQENHEVLCDKYTLDQNIHDW